MDSGQRKGKGKDTDLHKARTALKQKEKRKEVKALAEFGKTVPQLNQQIAFLQEEIANNVALQRNFGEEKERLTEKIALVELELLGERAKHDTEMKGLWEEIQKLQGDITIANENLATERRARDILESEFQSFQQDSERKIQSLEKGATNFQAMLGLDEGDDPAEVKRVLKVFRYPGGKKKGRLLSEYLCEKLFEFFPDIGGKRKIHPFSKLEERQQRRRKETFGNQVQERVNNLGNYLLSNFELVQLIAIVDGKTEQYNFVDVKEEDRGRKIKFKDCFKVLWFAKKKKKKKKQQSKEIKNGSN